MSHGGGAPGAEDASCHCDGLAADLALAGSSPGEVGGADFA